MRRYQHILLCVAASLLIGTWAGSARARAELELRPTVEAAIAGIPVVMELAWHNPTGAEVTAHDLADPFLLFTMWEWKSQDGKTHEVKLEHYHYTALPRPLRPLPVALKPGERRSWHATVPTPSDFLGRERWTLALTLRDLDGGKGRRASVQFHCRAPAKSCLTGKVEPALAQAALLEFARHDAIDAVGKGPGLRAVEACATGGDPQARLVLFSAALSQGQDVAKRWRDLEGCSEEVRCLRDYLLLSAARDRRSKMPAEDLKAILAGDAGGPFGKELKQAFAPDSTGASGANAVPPPGRSKEPARLAGPPLAAEERERVAKVVVQHTEAVSAGEVGRCMAMLTEDFRYKGFDKDGYGEDLKESAGKIKRITATGATFRLKADVGAVTEAGDRTAVEAEVTTTPLKDGKPMEAPRRWLWDLHKAADGSWRIAAMRDAPDGG